MGCLCVREAGGGGGGKRGAGVKPRGFDLQEGQEDGEPVPTHQSALTHTQSTQKRPCPSSQQLPSAGSARMLAKSAADVDAAAGVLAWTMVAAGVATFATLLFGPTAPYGRCGALLVPPPAAITRALRASWSDGGAWEGIVCTRRPTRRDAPPARRRSATRAGTRAAAGA